MPKKIPFLNPVEFILVDDVPGIDPVEWEWNDGEPIKFYVTAERMSACWKEFKELKEEIEFLVDVAMQSHPFAGVISRSEIKKQLG